MITNKIFQLPSDCLPNWVIQAVVIRGGFFTIIPIVPIVLRHRRIGIKVETKKGEESTFIIQLPIT
jgi:hypothetical protein